MKSNIIIAQINPTVGDIAGNTQKTLDVIEQYASDEAALLVFPELAITGYPPEDLLNRPAFVADAMAAVDELVEKSKAFKCSLLIGGVWLEHGLTYNAAMMISDGRVSHVHKKNSLPNYGVFDERRYFAQGSAPVVCEHLGQKLGVLICEDGWFEHNWRLLKVQGAEQVLVLNASPFEVGKQQGRIQHFSQMAKTHGLGVAYVNMAGAQDDLVFDGASFALDATGELTSQAVAFDSSITPLPKARGSIIPYPSELESIWLAVASGLKNYVHKNEISNVVLGLSGGIDSAVVATMAVDALGPEHVHAVLMPSEFTSANSNEDAEALAKNLGIKTSVVPIAGLMDAADSSLIPALEGLANVERWRENLAIGGNLQARLRGNILMAYSNALGGVVLNTSNKSEIAVGYSTMYGDACGAYSPLKDVYKTDVYALAEWRNTQASTVIQSVVEGSQNAPGDPSTSAGACAQDDAHLIPQAIIRKAPTAELAPGQQDSDQLPAYEVLDDILNKLIEERLSPSELAAQGIGSEVVQKIYTMLCASEYKRRQFPPGPKVSPMLFGKDWRYPLTNGYKG